MTKDNVSYSRIDDNIRLAQLVKNSIYRLTYHFFGQNEFVFVDPPILHEQIPNKKSEVYLSDLGNKYSLNSSNALYMAAYASEFKRVFAISPSFRNEQNSINHLVEFRMLEVEVTNMSFDEMVEIVVNYLKYILCKIREEEYFKEYPLKQERVKLLYKEFNPKVIPYKDFINMIGKMSECIINENEAVDLSDIDYIVSRFVDKPIIIVDYPQKIASWTARQKTKDYSYAMNMILPDGFGELCEGCERTNNVDLLRYKMNCAKITNLQWYIEAVKRIDSKRCGFGIGIDRLVRWIVGCENIEETVFFPRVKEG